jgi:hypothetical protein
LEVKDISVGTLGSWSLILGPVIAVVCYMIAPGVMLIDQADPADAAKRIGAIQANIELAQVTSLLIPIGVIMLLYGLTVVGGGGGNGEALSRLGILLFTFAAVGWTVELSTAGVLAGLSPAHAGAIGGVVYAIGHGIGTIASILGALGILCFALGMSARDGIKVIPLLSARTLALLVALASIVALVANVIGATDSSQEESMAMIRGIYFLVITAWSVTLGLGLRKSS